MKRIIKIGTRRSRLALVQTNLIIEQLQQTDPGLSFEVIPISTTGDEILDKPLIEFGGKGVFVAEFERALQNREIDLAVHSAKDMPMLLPIGLGIVGIPKREDPRDVLVSKGDGLSAEKPLIIGTSSLRRQMQIKQYFPKAQCVSLRGNVGTRLDKLSSGEYDGIILAAAGLKRLGLLGDQEYHIRYFTPEEFIPAGGQGILAVEGRLEDELTSIVRQINHEETAICLKTERSVLQYLNAGCHEAVGVFSYVEGKRIYLRAVYEQDDRICLVEDQDQTDNYPELADRAAKELMRQIR